MTTLYDSVITRSISADPSFNEIAQLLVSLGRGLHEAGEPTHKIERTLIQVAERFDVPLQVFGMPTGQILSFHRDDAPLTFVLRIPPAAVNLDRLSRLLVVARRLARGTLTPVAAKAHIDRIAAQSRQRGAVATVCAYTLSAAAFSVFFGGGWTELAVATCVGLAVGLIAMVLRRLPHPTRLFELASAAAAALIAGTADWILGAYGGWIPVASGLIVLLPGIAMVDSMEELANGHLVAGSARLAGAGVVFLALTFGVVLGYWTAGLVPDQHDVPPTPFAPWAVVPALLVVAAGSTLRFRARPADWMLILLASSVALFGSRLGTAWAGPLHGPFMAALALGTLANLYARWSERAAELIAVPGLALLVPGSIGYQSLESLLGRDTTVGIEAAFQMVMVATALVAGLLFSDWLVPDRPRQWKPRGAA